jgi:hypothetical protein
LKALHCKKNLQIPVFFLSNISETGKPPMLTRDFLLPSREGIFCLLRREKYSSFCRGNFFLSFECYISVFPLLVISLLNVQENYWKIPGWPQECRADP